MSEPTTEPDDDGLDLTEYPIDDPRFADQGAEDADDDA